MAGDFYYPIYLTVVSALTFYQCSRYQRIQSHTLEVKKQVSLIQSSAFVLLLIAFIGFRPQASCFVDMNNYIAFYYLMEGRLFQFNPETENILFDNMFNWIASMQLGWPFFFLLMAAIYFGGMWVCCQKMFAKNAFAALLVCLGAFSTFSYGTNGVKAGAAASLFLMAVVYRRNLYVCIPLLFVTLGFHHSMTLPIGAFIIAYFYKNTKHFFIAWFVCMLLAAAHVSYFQNLLAGMSDESGSGYLTSSGQDWGGKEGFRYDFVLYSAMPVCVGYWAIFKRRIKSLEYEFLLSIYLITNSVWMLCMYASFTNRIAYLSWFLYPVVLIYPYLNEDVGTRRYKHFSKVMALHLLFTLFMTIVYY